MNLATEMRIVVLAFALAALAVWIIVYHRLYREERGIALLCIAWSLHCIVFGVVVWLRIAPSVALNVWSNALRAHGLLAIFLIGVDLALEHRTHA